MHFYNVKSAQVTVVQMILPTNDDTCTTQRGKKLQMKQSRISSTSTWKGLLDFSSNKSSVAAQHTYNHILQKKGRKSRLKLK